MSSDAFDPDNHLTRALLLLSADRLIEEVDEPIEEAMSTLGVQPVALSHASFGRVLAQIVQHLYRFGIRLRRSPTGAEAFAEAIALLDEFYQSAPGQGYETAYYEASISEEDWIAKVVSCVTESAKARERRAYVQWVYASAIEHLPWNWKQGLTEVFLDRFRSYLSPGLLQCSAARLTAHCRLLIESYLETKGLLQEVPIDPHVISPP